MNDRILSLLSLATKAGKTVGGEMLVEKAVKEGKASLVIISSEASGNTRKKFNLEHCNNITNSAGRRVWGFMGVEAVARPNINGFYDVSPCTYVPEEWQD